MLIPRYIKFISKNKKDKINRKVMFQGYDNGGIRAPSIETMSKSLKLAWILRFLINDQMCSESWKVIPNYYFDKYGGLKFLLHCNYDKRFLKQVNFLNFYKQILLFFSELKSSYSSESDQESYSTLKKFELTVKQSFIRAGSVEILFLFKIF